MDLLLVTQLVLGATIISNVLLILFVATTKGRPFLHKVFIVQLLGILAWTLGIFLNLWLENMFVERVVFFSAGVALVAQLYFVFLFPESQKNGCFTSRSMGFIIGIGCAFAIASFIPDSVFSSITVTEAGYTIVHPGWLSGGYVAFAFTFIVSAIILLAHKRTVLTDATLKKQAQSLLFGFIVFFITSLLTNAILPVAFNIYFFNGIGPAFSLILAIFIVYTITQHHFLGIRRALQRSFVFMVLLTLIIAFYLSCLTLANALVSGLSQTAILVSAGITTAIGIFTVPLLDRFLREVTDRFFFKGHYDYAKTLYALSEEINKSLNVDDMKHLAERTLGTLFRAESVTIDIAGSTSSTPSEPQVNTPDRVTLTVPIMSGREHIGRIHLGEKRSGDTYTDEDEVLLRTFSHQIALAFEKARLFKEVEDYSCELEERVRARTAEVLALQEQQSQMMLDLSHKLQNPLTIIKNEIALLRKNGANEVECALFERTIDDTSAFIYDLLRIAHLETAENVFHAETHDMSSHLLELIEYMTLVAREHGITITHSIPPHITFSYDQEKVTELVTNLVSNAVKYMGDAVVPKERRIHVSLIPHDTTIELSVSDTGIGIDACDLPHVFDRFFRTGHVQGTAVRGTGLGLAICKKIVEMHGGTIKVTSTVGTGTTFTISLPTTTECRADAEF